MGLSIAKIFKQALVLTKTRRFLWGYGLFLIWSNLVVYWIIVSSRKPSVDYEQSTNVIIRQLNFSQTIVDLTLVLVLIILILVWFYIRSRAAVALAVRDIMDHKPTSFWQSFKSSKKAAKRLLALWGLLLSCFVICLAALILPIGYLMSLNFNSRASILGVLALLIFIPLGLMIIFLNKFSGLFIVLLNLKVTDSIKAAYELVTKFWWPLVSMGLNLISLSFLTMLAGLFVQVLVLIPFVILSGLPYDMVGFNINSPYIISGISLSFVVLFWMMAVVASFQQTCWILVFLELVKPKKVEAAEEAAVVPEVI